MSAPTVYKSSDASAPTLSGTTGSLVALLDACLVNGYGSQTAAGWTKAFSGTNTASYKQGTASGADCYLDVNDNGAGAGGAKEATVRGYEAMTAVGTGTNAFPTTAQVASPGMFIRKSATADSTSRGWVVIADDKTVSVFILSADSAGAYMSFHFGEFFSLKSTDAYRCVIIGSTATGSSTSTGLANSSLTSFFSGGLSGCYVPRVAAGTGTSNNEGLMGFAGWNNPPNGPSPLDGNLYLSRLFLAEGNTTGIRGYLRGVYQLINGGGGVLDGDTFTGAGDFAGKTFVILKSISGSGAVVALETTAWDTST